MTDVTTAPCSEPDKSKNRTSRFLKIYFNTILICTSINPGWPLSLGLSTIHLANPPRMLHAMSLIRFLLLPAITTDTMYVHY